jgi:hypothetical protein
MTGSWQGDVVGAFAVRTTDENKIAKPTPFAAWLSGFEAALDQETDEPPKRFTPADRLNFRAGWLFCRLMCSDAVSAI